MGSLSQNLNEGDILELLKGIDVSRWQGDIDWEAVKGSGIDFVIIKITGADNGLYTDRRAIFNVTNARNVGFTKIGGYHYAYYKNVNEANKEASYFKSIASELGLDFAVLDIEYKGATGDLTEASIAFLESISTIAQPVIYASPSFIKSHFNAAITEYPLWIAHYGVDAPATPLWSDWQIWQQRSNGSTSGITGDVDINVMKSDFLKGGNYVEIVVVPSGPADVGAALVLAKALRVKMVYRGDIQENEKAIQIGGGQEVQPGCQKIIGSDFLDTAEKVIQYAKANR